MSCFSSFMDHERKKGSIQFSRLQHHKIGVTLQNNCTIGEKDNRTKHPLFGRCTNK